MSMCSVPVTEGWRSGANITLLRYSTPSVRLNLQTSLTSCLAWLILIAKKKNHTDGALDRNTAQLSIGTAMHSGSENRKTWRVLYQSPLSLFLQKMLLFLYINYADDLTFLFTSQKGTPGEIERKTSCLCL